MKRLAASLAVAVALCAPSLANAGDTLPSRPAPAGFRVVDAAGGGRIVTGPLAASASPNGAFLAGLRKIHAYFGTSPSIASAAQSNDGSLTVGLFRSELGRAPVAGVAFVTYAPNGGSRIAMLFDRPAHLKTSFHPMMARLAALDGGGAAKVPAGEAAAALVPRLSPDRTILISLPNGWKTSPFEQGMVAASGPNGEEVDRGIVLTIIDPRSPMARGMGGGPQGIVASYVPDPARAYAVVANALSMQSGHGPLQVTVEKTTPMQAPGAGAHAAALSGTTTNRGTRQRFEAAISVGPPSNYGTWSLAVNQMTAPINRYAADRPTLTAINDSYRMDQQHRLQQVQQSIAQGEAAGAAGRAMLAQTTQRDAALVNASMAHARAVQDGIDRSTAGFVNYLGDRDVLENTGSGARGTVGAGFAQAVVQSDPQNFRTVPVSQYRKGVDY
jgi:hypothetical protein